MLCSDHICTFTGGETEAQRGEVMVWGGPAGGAAQLPEALSSVAPAPGRVL